jgi:hypothetical protein
MLNYLIGAQKFMRKSRGHFVFLQSARGLAHSKTLRVFQESSCCAQRLGECGGPPPLFPEAYPTVPMLTGTAMFPAFRFADKIKS